LNVGEVICNQLLWRAARSFSSMQLRRPRRCEERFNSLALFMDNVTVVVDHRHVSASHSPVAMMRG
jgi:hypothetical protein